MYNELLKLYNIPLDCSDVVLTDNISLWHGYADKAQKDYLFELTLFDDDYIFDAILTANMSLEEMREKIDDMFNQAIERLDEDDVDNKADVIMQILALKECNYDKTH